MKKPVIYTAITRGYDTLKRPPLIWRDQGQFVAFLDEPQPDRGWEFRPICRRFRDPCRNAKIHKILSHKYFPESEYTLWVDGAVRINLMRPLDEWVEEYLRKHDIAIFRHPFRNCIYQEAAYCLQLGLDSARTINRQMQKYFDEGYPRDNGLVECTVILRRHTAKIKRFNEMWYKEIQAHSRRDQLSFNYIARKLGLKCNYFPLTLRNSPQFSCAKHARTRLKVK